MSISSDSEDEKLKLVLEAVDTNLLTNSLFTVKKQENLQQPVALEIPKSERNLEDNDQTTIDFVPTEAVQKLMSKKLTLLVQEQIEFIANSDANNGNKKHKQKSRVKLLHDFDCYVKSYEDFEYEELGPRTKPVITRRVIDKDVMDEESKLKSVAVAGEHILSGKEIKNWSKRSKGKVFCYKLGKGISKVHHFVETENEFTKLRRKNKWNESKIKNKINLNKVE